jgi:Tol biopolymer transport system component
MRGGSLWAFIILIPPMIKPFHRELLGVIPFALMASFSNLAVSQQSGPKHPYDSDKSMPEPNIFAAGIISTGDFESHPAFTPDGTTLYFSKDSPAFNFWTICVSYFREGRWSVPEVASFSGQYSDADPFITADGSKFFFISNRPLTPGDKPKEDLDIWMMTKERTGWSAPVNLGAPINSNGSEWYPTIAADGTLYFGSDRAGGKGQTDLYRSRFANGKYSEPENLGPTINTAADEFEPFVAPDQSFLIFMSQRPGGHGRGDLYLSYQRDGNWSVPTNLGDKINSIGAEYSPKISPNGKYFFWSSTRTTIRDSQNKRLSFDELTAMIRAAGNGLGDIYQIDIGALNLEKRESHVRD